MLIVAAIVWAGTAPLPAQETEHAPCPMLIFDESIRLEDALFAVELARSDFAAHEKIYIAWRGGSPRRLRVGCCGPAWARRVP
jgi:hypothetical protein